MTYQYKRQILTEDELKEAIELARVTSPGIYTLKKLYGAKWLAKDVQGIGQRFRESERRGLITGVKYHEDTSSHSAQYEIRRP